MTDKKRVGVLTGGGDAPGLNPAIKGLVYRGSELGARGNWIVRRLAEPDESGSRRAAARSRNGATLGSRWRHQSRFVAHNPFKQVNAEGETQDRSDEVVEHQAPEPRCARRLRW